MFFGWRVVAAAVTVFAYGDAVYGLGVWLHVLTAERGWSVAFVSACVTLHFLASAGVTFRLPALSPSVRGPRPRSGCFPTCSPWRPRPWGRRMVPQAPR